jgi:hypothetical protein
MADALARARADVGRLLGTAEREIIAYGAGHAPVDRYAAAVLGLVWIGGLLLLGRMPGLLLLALITYRVRPYRGLAVTRDEAVVVRCGITRARPNAVLARAPISEISLADRSVSVGDVSVVLSKRGERQLERGLGAAQRGSAVA